jgi:hypothetical protein
MRMAMRLVLLAALVVACAPSTPSPTVAVPTTTPAPTIDPAEIREWIAFRESFGLRADPAWVLEVAADPQSDQAPGIPLLPSEVKAMGDALLATHAVIDALRAYGARQPDLYADVIVEGARTILLMKGDVTQHRKVLESVLPADAAFEVRSVEWSMGELEAFVATVEADSDWFESIDAEFIAADGISSTDSVRVRYRAAGPRLDRVILGHFGNPSWMYAEWEGPLPWRGAIGTIEATVLDGQGRPVVDARCEWRPVDPTVDADTAFSFSTDNNGVCTNAYLPATAFNVLILVQRPGGDWEVIGTGHANVPPHDTIRITIVAKR